VAVADAGGPGRQREVAVEDQLETPGRRHPVDQRDHGYRGRPQATEDPVEILEEAGEHDRVALQADV